MRESLRTINQNELTLVWLIDKELIRSSKNPWRAYRRSLKDQGNNHLEIDSSSRI